MKKETFRAMLKRHSKEIKQRKKTCEHSRISHAIMGNYCVYCNSAIKEKL